MKKYKELSKRLSKIEKHLGLNTEVTVSNEYPKNNEVTFWGGKTTEIKNELTELPEKWCVKANKENRIWFKKKGYELETSDNNFSENDYYHWPSLPFGISAHYMETGYTEITFDQFNKWVLKEDDKPLSIREVQVKVTSQEEANECAEIAKECGEKINSLKIKNDIQYFRKDRYQEYFQVLRESDNYKTISIQEYRERFGKAAKFEIPKYITKEEALEFGRKLETKEIDWSKAGQLVENEDAKWIVISDVSDRYFLGFFIYSEEPNQFLYNTTEVLKKGKKLCTEPITLFNE